MLAILPFKAFGYSSYKEFLSDAYDHCHGVNEAVSYEKIATSCDLKTRTQAKNIIKGDQRPTPIQLNALGDFFKLSENEKKYLNYLLKFNDPKNGHAASELFQQLMLILKTEMGGQTNPFHNVQVMSSLLHLSILSIFEFNVDISLLDIKHFLKNRFELNKIEEAIEDLEKLHYIAIDKSNGKRTLLHKHLRQYDYNANFFLKNFHNECLDFAKKSLNEDPTSERYLIGASFAINHKVFPRLIQKINAFVENMMKMGELAGEPDMVVQLNSQLLKITSLSETIQKSVLGSTGAERELLN